MFLGFGIHHGCNYTGSVTLLYPDVGWSWTHLKPSSFSDLTVDVSNWQGFKLDLLAVTPIGGFLAFSKYGAWFQE